MLNAKDLKEQSSGLNILYAEDEAILRESMEVTLGKLFANLYVAKNGQEAFEIFKKEKIDIILTDINMPIMSGIEFIQSVHNFTDTPPQITVLSAHNESRLLTTLINSGIDSFLNKPLDKQHMINSLHKSCSRINDKKMLKDYEEKLQQELDNAERKNKILEQKLKQLALSTNKQYKKEVAGTFKKLEKESNNEDNYYATLLVDDRDELSDLSVELDNFIAMTFQSEELNRDYLIKISEVYQKFSAVLNGYPEFFEIGAYLLEFSKSILSLEDKFMENIYQTGVYLESLQMTLENYRLHVWHKEAKDPKFYNASLMNDIQVVLDYLEDKEIAENEIEFF